MKECKIDSHITLKLVEKYASDVKETRIYVDEEVFLQCNHLFVMNPRQNKSLQEIKSIDELAELLENEAESLVEITAEEEFWGHCANLQAWVEISIWVRKLDVSTPNVKRSFLTWLISFSASHIFLSLSPVKSKSIIIFVIIFPTVLKRLL
ncbi:hypothetical protein LCGC14_2284340 [marine sediment metagenome]|uniref:Uncharacterized protein n=1 Tax=marine sediment metagenome TaxID=412755 RepID=A0A0F9DFL3_9ZZZZ